jgi:hypothetical protein
MEEPDNLVEPPRPQEVTKLYQCLLIFAGFMAMFQIIGINSSYGVFQQYYASKDSFLSPKTSTSAIAFIGTMGKMTNQPKMMSKVTD